MKHWFLPTPQNGYRAFLLRTPALVLMLVVLLIGNNLVGIIPIQQVGAEISLATLLNMHNTERTKRGLPPFKLNAALSNSAQQKAVVMLENDCWSHYCPQGKSPWDFVLNAGYPYLFAGENLAQGFTDNEATMVAWMDSPTHRDNILRPEFEDIGFGIVQGSFQGYNSNVIIVVHFGTPQPSSDTLLSTSRRDLPTPTITSPRDGSYIGEPVIDVQGRAEQASQVGIIKDGIEWVKVDVRDGAFTYRSPELADGVYQLNAQSFVGTRQSALSETTEFTVDTTADSIKATQFTVMGAANGNVKVQMAAEYLLQAEMQFEDRKVKLLPLTSTIWEANVPEELLQAESFVLSNRDLAGNAWEGSFKSELIKAQLRLIPGFNQLGVSAASQPQVLPARANLNIGIVIFLSMLTLIDFIILSKSGLTYRQSRRHLHLAVFIVVIIMTLIGGFIGKIGVGISNF